MSREFGSSSAGRTGSGAREVPKVPGHELLRLIGGGGYGEVWLARTVMGTYRAIKVVYRDNFSEERPFIREFEGTQRFEPISREHPGLVDVLQVGRDDQGGFFYYVMELADDAGEGQNKGPEEGLPSVAVEAVNSAPKPINPESYTPKTLRKLLRPLTSSSQCPTDGRRYLPVRSCLEIARELAAALECLHKNGLVHRDIKPSNIIFVKGVAKLADIGLVAAANEECSFVGTQGFVAPEGPGRPQADVFALGKVLYEMLTGFNALEGTREGYPNMPDEWLKAPNRDELLEVNRVALRACQGNTTWRYRDAAQLRSDLELLISGKSLAMRQLQRTIDRLRGIIASIVAAVLLVFSISGLWFFKNRAAEQDRRRELREIQISRMQVHEMGWFSNDWQRLQRAAAIRKDQDLLEQGTALLAGWEARLVKNLVGPAAGSAAFAPDGRGLVGGAEGSPALLIDAKGNTSELGLPGDGVVCWPDDGVPLQLIVVSNRVILREALTGVLRNQFKVAGSDLLLPNEGCVLAISPEGDKVAVATGNRLLSWEAGSGKLLGEVGTKATALAFAPDGSILGAGCRDGTASVYAMPALTEIATLRPALRGNPITCLAFTRDRVVPYGKEIGTNSWLMAVGDQGTGIVIWDLNRRMPRSFCRGSTWTVASLAFSPDGLTLASAGRNSPRLWDMMSGRLLFELPGAGSGEVTALTFDRTGRRLLYGGLAEEGTAGVKLLELEPHRGIQGLPGLASPVRKVWFSRDSELVAALSDDWHVGVWGLNPRRLVFIFETPVGTFADNAAGCFDALGTHFAFSAGQQALLYDLATGHVVQRWSLQGGLCDELRWDVKGRLLLLRRERARERGRGIWRLYALSNSQSPELLHEQTETNWVVRDVALPEGARRFLVWSGGPKGAVRSMHVYDTETGRELWTAATERIEGDLRVCIEPRGEVFGYTASNSNSHLRLIRFSDFSELGTTAEDCDAIAPSGRGFARNGWFFPDTSGKSHGIPLLVDRGGASLPAFSPNGALLAWGTSEGDVFVVDTQELQRRLSSLLP
jgi:WD40 repeat protein